MTIQLENQNSSQNIARVRVVGTAQRLGRLRHTGYVAGERHFSGCVLRVDGNDEVRFIACVRVVGSCDEGPGEIALRRGFSVVEPAPNAAGWDEGLLAAALAADALAERASNAERLRLI